MPKKDKPLLKLLEEYNIIKFRELFKEIEVIDLVEY
jgi:hypothetical protein